MVQAMEYVLAGMTPYAAAQRAEVGLNTMYRSKLYKMWLAGNMDGLNTAMNAERPAPRRAKKRARFIHVTAIT
jgi:transposase